MPLNMSGWSHVLQANNDGLVLRNDVGLSVGTPDLRQCYNANRISPYGLAWLLGLQEMSRLLRPGLSLPDAIRCCQELGKGSARQKLHAYVCVTVSSYSAPCNQKAAHVMTPHVNSPSILPSTCLASPHASLTVLA